ncbi:MAG: hypothetical protein HQM12_05580 [SAR324 cluster bacterium]|nr:hypothetical protein [SAR324 cluster bacterium]
MACANTKVDVLLTSDKSDHQIKLLGIEAIKNELGVLGLIRFMQQFDTGSGNYTEERHEWQDHYTVDSLIQAIKKQRQDKKS